MRYRSEIEAYFRENAGEMLKDISKLIEINSEKMAEEPGMPYGKGPYEALNKALEIAGNMGFAVKNYDNYVGTVDLNDLEKGLDILAHLDVVPGGDGWTVTKPFVPVIADGKIYGRGAADDKGPAVAALYAMKAVKDLRIDLKKNVRLIVGTDEECGSSDIEHYYAVEQEAPVTFSPDGDFPLINIEKGGLRANFTASWEEDFKLPRIYSIHGGIKSNVVPGKASALVEGVEERELEEAAKKVSASTKASFSWGMEDGRIKVEALGENAHAATPYTGNNALTALLELLVSLPFADSEGFTKVKQVSELFPHGDCSGRAAGVFMEDEESGELTLNFGILNYSTKELTGNFDCRAPICATNENLRDVLKNNMKRLGLELEDKDIYPPHHVPADTPFIRTLLDCYEEYTGNKGECLAIGGGTYVHSLERGVAFGCSMPGTDNNMHGPDEFAVIEELLVSGMIFAQAIIELCS